MILPLCKRCKGNYVAGWGLNLCSKCFNKKPDEYVCEKCGNKFISFNKLKQFKVCKRCLEGKC